MKILKTVGIIVLSFLIVIFIASMAVSTEANYEASINVEAPIAIVWENVNSHADLDKWNPWSGKDPDMKVTRPEQDGVVGATQSWDSENPDVGKGLQTIRTLEAPHLIETDLKFLTPYESEAIAFVRLEAVDSTTTTVTWGFESEMPRPFNLMSLFVSMDEMIGPDYQSGLQKLKALCEPETELPSL